MSILKLKTNVDLPEEKAEETLAFLWARDFYRVIVDEGSARVNDRAIEIESESRSNYFCINLLVVQNFI